MRDENILESLETDADLERALTRRGETLVFRHSPREWQSFMAIGQVRRFALDHPDLPVYVVDAAAHPELARQVGLRLGVPDESPQVILVRRGRPVWQASREGVRHPAMTAAIGD